MDQPLIYEELLDGSVPCPSCSGTGRIPKEYEKELIALIPITDKRLRPRRTVLWVCLAVLICLTILALCMFFLVPRSINLHSDNDFIIPYYSYISESEAVVELGFVKWINITNNNYVTITVVNASMMSVYVLESPRVVDQITNLTQVVVPLRSTRSLAFNATIRFENPVLVQYCNLIHIIFMQFDVTVTSYYMGHSEQSSVSSNQRVFCKKDPLPDDL